MPAVSGSVRVNFFVSHITSSHAQNMRLGEQCEGPCIPSVQSVTLFIMAVPWLRRIVAGLSPRRLGFDPGSVHMGFLVDKVALGLDFPRVLRFSPVSFIPPVLHYKEKRKKNNHLQTWLHNKPLGCGASVASAAGSLTTKKIFI
jgi:hypothetical protein